MAILSSNLLVRFDAIETVVSGIGSPQNQVKFEKLIQFTGGTGLNQFDVLWTSTGLRTIAASGNDDLDLAGVLASAFGQSIASVEVVGIIVVAEPTNPGNLLIGNAATNAWFAMFGATGHTIKVGPGGVFANFAPDAAGLGTVVAGTGDILRIANASGAGSASYRIALALRSA